MLAPGYYLRSATCWWLQRKRNMFSILVKIESFEKRRRNAGLLHVLLGFFLVIKAFDVYSEIEVTIWNVLPYLIVAGISLYYGFFRKKADPQGKHNLSIRLLQAATFFIFGITLLRTGGPVEYFAMFIWAALNIVLLLTERKIFHDTYIVLDEDGVRIPSFYRDHIIAWSALESVVVRHDFVTFFNRNNRFIQFQVMQTLSELEVAKANAFCREKIEPYEPSENKAPHETKTQ